MTDDQEDMQARIDALTERVAELERAITAVNLWLPALSSDILKSRESVILMMTGKDHRRMQLLTKEIFENYYLLNPDKRPNDG